MSGKMSAIFRRPLEEVATVARDFEQAARSDTRQNDPNSFSGAEKALLTRIFCKSPPSGCSSDDTYISEIIYPRLCEDIKELTSEDLTRSLSYLRMVPARLSREGGKVWKKILGDFGDKVVASGADCFASDPEDTTVAVSHCFGSGALFVVELGGRITIAQGPPFSNLSGFFTLIDDCDKVHYHGVWNYDCGPYATHKK